MTMNDDEVKQYELNNQRKFRNDYEIEDGNGNGRMFERTTRLKRLERLERLEGLKRLKGLRRLNVL
jgi:hypothetical protein